MNVPQLRAKSVDTNVRTNKSLMARLRSDTAGNTIAMAAAALVPLMGMVGGAVDASRYYMSQSRLQNACDSGALAARKAMGNDTFAAQHQTVAENFFDQNFTDGLFGTTNRTRTFTAGTDGEVIGTASAVLPVSLMQVFGFGDFAIDVSCTADINISNTDIMFVLDVTGSMNCPDDGSFCPNGNNGNVEAPNARIRGLRSAVLTFYDTVEASTSNSAQVRYGLLPYASNVNVGFEIPLEYLDNEVTIQSREPNFTTRSSFDVVSLTVDNVTNRSGENRNGFIRTSRFNNVSSSSACLAKPLPAAYTDRYLENTIRGSTVNITSNETNGTTNTITATATASFRRGAPVHRYNSRRRRCNVGHEIYDYTATGHFTQIAEVTTTSDFDNWTYRPVTYDVTDFAIGAIVETPTGRDGAMIENRFTGCIEEADTVAQATFDPVPNGAHDLDINLIPSNDAERWKVQLPLAAWRRETNNNSTNYLPDLTHAGDERQPFYDCPRPVERLSEISREGLVDFLAPENGFDARSNTYHDIGMIWGARFISPNGIFAADNATAPNGDAIARHIVFMTDGILATNNETYGTYGIEWWDRRISGNGDQGTASSRHAERFQAACRAARQENISVWVVAFGTTLSQNLIDCATPGRAFAATDSADLADRFEEIAEKIAALRLTE